MPNPNAVSGRNSGDYHINNKFSVGNYGNIINTTNIAVTDGGARRENEKITEELDLSSEVKVEDKYDNTEIYNQIEAYKMFKEVNDNYYKELKSYYDKIPGIIISNYENKVFQENSEIAGKLNANIKSITNGKFDNYESFIEEYERVSSQQAQIDELIKQLEKEARLNSYRKIQESDDFKNFDYEKYSEERLYNNPIAYEELDIKFVNISAYSASPEITNKYKNAISEFFGEGYYEYLGLDVDYFKMFYYYCSKYGDDVGAKFLMQNKEIFNEATGLERTIDTYNEMGGKSTTAKLLNTHLEGISDGLINSVEGIEAWLSENPEKTSNYYEVLYTSTLISKGVYGDPKLYGLDYSVGQGVGNMLPSVLLSAVNPYLGSVYLATSAGGNTYRELRWSGEDLATARFKGLLAGASEVVTEKWLGALPFLSEVKVTGFKTWLTSMVREGSQEVLQDMITSVILGEGIDFDLEKMANTFVVSALTSGEMNLPCLIRGTANSIIHKEDIKNLSKDERQLLEKIADKFSEIKTPDGKIKLDPNLVMEYLLEHPDATVEGLIQNAALRDNGAKPLDVNVDDRSIEKKETFASQMLNKLKDESGYFAFHVKKDNNIQTSNATNVDTQSSGNVSQNIINSISYVMQDIDNKYGKGTANQALRNYILGKGDLSIFPLKFQNAVTNMDHNSLVNIYNRVVTNYSVTGNYLDHIYSINRENYNNMIYNMESRGVGVDSDLRSFLGRNLSSEELAEFKGVLAKWFGADAGNIMRSIVSVINTNNTDVDNYFKRNQPLINNKPTNQGYTIDKAVFNDLVVKAGGAGLLIDSILRPYLNRQITDMELSNIGAELKKYYGSDVNQVMNQLLRYGVSPTNKAFIADSVNQRIMSNVSYAIQQIENKYASVYGKGYGIKALLAFVDPSNSYYGDNRLITADGNARNIISQYSIGDVRNALINLGYLKRRTTSDFFHLRGNAKDFTFGADQGGIEKLCIFRKHGKEYSFREALKMKNEAIQNGNPAPQFQSMSVSPVEYNSLFKSLVDEGFSSRAATIIMSSLNDAGACSYATVINEIFSYFNCREEDFRRYFGYDMYITDKNGKTKFNSNKLLLDLYIFANKIQNGGTFINPDLTLNITEASSKIDMWGNNMLNAENQICLSTSGGKKTNIIDAFLKTKGLNYANVKTFNYYNYGASIDFNSAIAETMKAIDLGMGVGLDIFVDKINHIPIKMESVNPSIYSSTNTNTWGEGGGHSVFITGYDANYFYVSSWGEEYKISFSDLQKSGKFVINISQIYHN